MPEPSIHRERLNGRVIRTAQRLIDFAQSEKITDLRELRDARLPWFEVRNAGPDASPTTTNNTPRIEATVFIYDEIGGSLGVQASELVQQIHALDVTQINVRINSPGGNVFDALAIHAALLHHPAHVTTYVDGIAASAASVIAMAGDDVVMMPGAEMMIHDASNMLEGNAKAHEADAKFLDRQSDNIAEIYAARAGGTPGEWRDLMLAETWVYAREAVRMRLATSVWTVTPYPDASHPKEVPYDAVEARMARKHDLRHWHYRYANRADAPVPGGHQTRSAVTVRPRPERPLADDAATARAAAPHAERMSAANRRAAAFGEMSQTFGRQLQLRECAPSGTARPAVGFDTARLTAVSKRRDGKEFVFVNGYATVYDRPYEMWDMYGPYDEVVSMGAADETLASNPDTAFLVNHRGLTMARTTNGSLDLGTDTSGMEYQAWLNPTRPDVQLLRTAIDDGEITESSFAFLITRGEWSDDFLTFYIRAFDINRGDVSPVNYGANPFTSVSARTREILNELSHLPGPAAREAVRRLSERLQIPDAAPDVDLRFPTAVDILPEPVAADLSRQIESGGRSLAHVQAMLTLLESD